MRERRTEPFDEFTILRIRRVDSMLTRWYLSNFMGRHVMRRPVGVLIVDWVDVRPPLRLPTFLEARPNRKLESLESLMIL